MDDRRLQSMEVIGSHGLAGRLIAVEEGVASAGGLGNAEIAQAVDDAAMVALLDQEKRAWGDAVADGEMLCNELIQGLYGASAVLHGWRRRVGLAAPANDQNPRYRVGGWCGAGAA